MRAAILRSFLASLLLVGGCFGSAADITDDDEVGAATSSLTAAQRRARAGLIRDVAAAHGMTEGWLLAGIADAETGMSHCWSELTWACQGPNSVDCGGGPVVAGAGDGPCHLRQGGLGMFQFDAGTYDDTLRREGTRVLLLNGNVEAAVDFVVGMVIRSTYISGISNRAQAIEWMNGVRIGNARWDPWVRTVVHYYNGCRPTSGCWSSRFPRYRDMTAAVHDEMGADFWRATPDFSASYVAQTFPLARDPFVLEPGEARAGHIELRNDGDATWRPGHTFLGTTEPRDGASPLAGPDWVSPHRAATVDREVAPGGTGRFVFTVVGPSSPGEYPQYFNLVEEGVAWFSDQGGPPDAQLQVRVTVSAPAPCPEGLDETWRCGGEGRQRCVAGVISEESCEHGCAEMAGSPDLCLDEVVDEDGDGFPNDVDCDDTDPTIYPGAPEICGDGIDQSCDGMDLPCESFGDAGVPDDAGPPGASLGGRTLYGSCAASPGAPTPAWPFALAFIPVALRRRRR